VLWKPWADADCEHAACLQRLWFRIFDDRLLLAAHMRSNDAYKAAFMNMYAFTDLQRHVAERVSEGLGREIKVGQYNHVVDSFHIYGSYFEDFKGFLQTLENRTFEQRTYRTEDVQVMIDEAKEKIAASLAREAAGGQA
jgi:thymidylate synthase